MRGLIALLLAVATMLVLPALTCAQEAGDEWTEPITGMEFVWVPGGCYEMGCGEWAGNDCHEDEYPAHEVCVDGFWMGKYEVLQEEWWAVMSQTNSEHFLTGIPVNYATWNKAQDFIRRLRLMSMFLINYRLPNEVEWEFACRSGGQEEIYAGSNNPSEVAWYSTNAGERIQPVGTKAPNGLGLYDMSGNVCEWVQDLYQRDAYGNNNAQYELGSHSRIYRGGNCYDQPISCRCTYRNAAPQNSTYKAGFRIIYNN